MTYQYDPFKPINQMTLSDWQEIGFMSGLEVHQQLLTQRKLFCRCPAGHYTKDFNAEILRHMRPTLSEMGEYDPTALMEFKTKKEIIYQLTKDSVCTYEMDDAPPFEVDDHALDIALEIGMLLNLSLVSELHIARKQYLDGSIPTGFQRTTIVGVEGEIKVKDRTVRIRQLGMEEDACRIISDIGHTVTFRTDRLGMPLVETVTYPDMRTPEEVAETGEVIRRLCRTTGKVRIGHGAAREDINVSVRGGTRVEIKGVPSLRAAPSLVYHEAMRQWNLLRIRELLLARGLTPEQFASESRIVTPHMQKTLYGPLRMALQRGWEVGAVRLDGYAGILKERVMPGINFAREISERLRVIACLNELPNILHSDSMEHELTNNLWERIRRALRVAKDDALVVVWGPLADVKTAMGEIVIRAREALEGIPSETRQSNKDGTTGFERILPGPSRMYPDTDLPPKAIADDRLTRIRATLPDHPWTREIRWRGQNLPEDVIATFHRYPDLARLYEDALRLSAPNCARNLGVFVGQRLRALARRGAPVTALFSPQTVATLLQAVADKRIHRETLFYLTDEVAKAGNIVTTGEVLEDYEPRTDDEADAVRILPELYASVSAWRSNDPTMRANYLAGQLMRRFRGRLSWRQALTLTTQYFSEANHG